jgi:phytoene synthase
LDQAIVYCADQVKQFDRDRYTVCAGVSHDTRDALYALYAYNLEVAKIREVVSEPMLGQIRLQWWREAIEGIYKGTPRDHAVVAALVGAIDRYKPTQSRFERLMDARELDLEDRQPETLKELSDYADATSGELACIALELLQAREPDLMEKARMAGAAWALCGLLYAVPFHAAQGRCYLPKELTDRHGIFVHTLYSGSSDLDLSPVVSEIVTVAQNCIESLEGGIALNARPALAGLSVVTADLRRLKKAKFDVFKVRPTGPFWRRWLLIKDLQWGYGGARLQP